MHYREFDRPDDSDPGWRLNSFADVFMMQKPCKRCNIDEYHRYQSYPQRPVFSFERPERANPARCVIRRGLALRQILQHSIDQTHFSIVHARPAVAAIRKIAIYGQ